MLMRPDASAFFPGSSTARDRPHDRQRDERNVPEELNPPSNVERRRTMQQQRHEHERHHHPDARAVHGRNAEHAERRGEYCAEATTNALREVERPIDQPSATPKCMRRPTSAVDVPPLSASLPEQCRRDALKEPRRGRSVERDAQHAREQAVNHRGQKATRG